MAQPDTSKKVVDQTGYVDEVDAPFTSNYQELYREMLVKNRLLYEKIDQIELLVSEINDMVDSSNAEVKSLIGDVQELFTREEDIGI